MLHKLKDDNGLEEWYEGIITSMDETNEEITVEYKGYSESFIWKADDLLQDRINGDLHHVL